MTKTKAQLRAEAVERLRKLNCMDVDCYQLLEATVDDAGEKVGYRVEIRKLIDLLTDDAHEARGSYEERLHDVPVSDCPYCGCKRVVIHDYSEMYEEPHSYRVEHMDEKEAFEAGCFESYYSFDSAKEAVEHANMRDMLTDDETCPNSDGTCPHCDRTPSIEQGDDGVAKLDAQARAEIEDAERSANAAESHGDAQRAVLSADADTDKGEGVKAAQDSRERLEAEIRYEYNGRIEWVADQIIGWLDRQAAITQDETIHDYNIAARESGRILRDEIAELQADRDELQRQLGTMRAVTREFRDERDEWKAKAKTQRNNFYQATEVIKQWQRKYETVKAERDELKSKADAHEADKASWQSGYHIDRIAKLQAQRDRYRDLLSKAVDEAQGIVKLMEVDS